MTLDQKVYNWIKQTNITPTQRAMIVCCYLKRNEKWEYTGDCVGYAEDVKDPTWGIPSAGVCFTLPNNIGICTAYSKTVIGKLSCMGIFATPAFEPYIKKVVEDQNFSKQIGEALDDLIVLDSRDSIIEKIKNTIVTGIELYAGVPIESILTADLF